MTQQNSSLTLSKSQSATSVSSLERSSSPKSDISSHLLQTLPSYLDPSKVVNVVLRGEYFGTWETPLNQRKAGFQLMAADSKGNEKHIKNFYFSKETLSAVKQECADIATALSATFIDTTINFNVEA